MTAAGLMPVWAGLALDVLDVCWGMNGVLVVLGIGRDVLVGEAGLIVGVVLRVGADAGAEVETDMVETLTMLALRWGVAPYWNCK